ncbi:hypothetical protein SCHIN_v1c10490 [Spiroplasma chinense]|uniref:Uncharacterized protein n=1 Tax=Spiroplasma chinense TaxID=216932 RepID=A0A5B9Y891_9MOLU|nr:hypothetical protein [Spiroplasma chinense]QEH62242.1 hypothetical protein SCHIN_v1c10490 [Spiroplasma chinense]
MNIAIDNDIDLNSSDRQDTIKVENSSQDVNKNFDLDIVFQNEVVMKNNKKYFKLFFRPSISEKKWNSICSYYFGKNPNAQSISLYFNGGTCVFYAQVGSELKQIVFEDKTDRVDFGYYRISKSENNKYEFLNYEFKSVLIPYEYFEDNNFPTIRYTASYKYTGNFVDEGSVTGLINLNRKPQIYRSKNNLTQYNLISSYLTNQFNVKYETGNRDLITREIDYEVLNTSVNRLDFDVSLKFKESWLGKVETSIYGTLVTNFLNQYVSGVSKVIGVSSTNEILLNNKESYYDLKLKDDAISSRNDQYLIENQNFTAIDWKTNKVSESIYGQKGILLNPLISDRVVFKKTLKLNDLNLVFENEFLDSDYTNIFNSRIDLNFEAVKVEELNYLHEDYYEVDWNDKESAIKFIHENQKNIL